MKFTIKISCTTSLQDYIIKPEKKLKSYLEELDDAIRLDNYEKRETYEKTNINKQQYKENRKDDSSEERKSRKEEYNSKRDYENKQKEQAKNKTTQQTINPCRYCKEPYFKGHKCLKKMINMAHTPEENNVEEIEQILRHEYNTIIKSTDKNRWLN